MLMGGMGTSSSFGEEEPGALDVFLEDNGMWVGVIVLVVVMTFAILWTAAAFKRQGRLKAMVPAARGAGLEYSPDDPFGCTSVDFPLFRVGDGRTVSNVMWRADVNGHPIRVFDFEYFEEHRVERGVGSRSAYDPEQMVRNYSYFTCAMAQHNGLWPPIRVIRERVLDKAMQKAGLPDIELESEEFNRLFVVQCEDRKFATDLLSPEMMEYLLGTQGEFGFETKGRWLLVSGTRLSAPEMPAFLNLTEQFIKRIPPVVWDIYPKAPDGEGPTEFGIDLGRLSPAASTAMIEENREKRSAPAVEYDLDGNPIASAEEDPW
jgi:hypothetical protein